MRHLAPVALGEFLPAGAAERLRYGVCEQLLARRELGEPQIEVVALRIVLFASAPRQPPDGAQAQPFPGGPRRAESNDANAQAGAFSRMVTNSSATVGWMPRVMS